MIYYEVQISKETRETYGPNGTMLAWSWARDTFGNANFVPNPGKMQRWSFDGHRTFSFANQVDATEFALRWGG